MSAKTKLSPQHDALLTALAALGLSDREVERRCGVPQGFLAKARTGAREGLKAEPSWAALAKLAPASASPSPAPPSPAPPEAGAPSELVLAIRDATTLETLDGLAQRILEDLAAETIGPNVARALTEIVRERRQLLAAIAAERAAARSGEPLRLDVVFSEDWRAGAEVDA